MAATVMPRNTSRDRSRPTATLSEYRVASPVYPGRPSRSPGRSWPDQEPCHVPRSPAPDRAGVDDDGRTGLDGSRAVRGALPRETARAEGSGEYGTSLEISTATSSRSRRAAVPLTAISDSSRHERDRTRTRDATEVASRLLGQIGRAHV